MCCHITTGKQNHIGCVQLRGKMHYIDLIRCDCVYAWELNLLQTKIYNRNGENFIVFTATSNDIPHMKKRLKMDQLSWFNDLGMWDCLKQQQFTGGQNLCQICFSWTAPWHVEECYMAWVPTLPVGSGPCQTGAACLGTGHSDRSQMPFMWQHQAPWPFSLTLWEGRSQASMLPELGGHANFLSQNASPYQLPPPPPNHTHASLRPVSAWGYHCVAWHSFLLSSGLQLAKTSSPTTFTSSCNSHVSHYELLWILSPVFFNSTILIILYSNLWHL